jgi:hypothetical protein
MLHNMLPEGGARMQDAGRRVGIAAPTAYLPLLFLVPVTWLFYVNYTLTPDLGLDLRPLLFPFAIWLGARFGRIGLIAYLVGAFPFGFMTYSTSLWSVGGYLGEYLASIALIQVFSREGTLNQRTASVFPRLQQIFWEHPIFALLSFGLTLEFFCAGLSLDLDLYPLFILLVLFLGARVSSELDFARLIKAIVAAATIVALTWVFNPFYLNARLQFGGTDWTFGHQLTQLLTDFATMVMALIIGRLIAREFRGRDPMRDPMRDRGPRDADTGTIISLALVILLFAPIRLEIGVNLLGLSPQLQMTVGLPIAYAFAFYLGSRYAMNGVTLVAIAATVLFGATEFLVTNLATPDDPYRSDIRIYDRTLDGGLEFFARLAVRYLGFTSCLAAPVFALVGSLAIRKYRQDEVAQLEKPVTAWSGAMTSRPRR